MGRVRTHQACISPFLRPPTSTATRVPELDASYTSVRHNAHLPPSHFFTDGSYDPSSGAMGSAVLLPGGHAAIMKPPGRGSSYVAELYALALGSLLCTAHGSIFSDSKGALAAVSGSSRRVFHSHLVEICRAQVVAKQLRLHHVKGHCGQEGNEEADRLAKNAAATLPTPPPQSLHTPLDISFHGRLQFPPHKTWTRYLLPSHLHSDISHVSWKPLQQNLAWIRWNFGCVSAPGFSHPKGYWFDEPSRHPCTWCNTRHHQSVHGMLTCPDPSQPLVQAWLQSWGPYQGTSQAWRAQACPRDRFLLGKLVIPSSLHDFLRGKLGPRKAKSAIHLFQASILGRLNPILPTFSPAQKANFRKRPNPWSMDDWLLPPT